MSSFSKHTKKNNQKGGLFGKSSKSRIKSIKRKSGKEAVKQSMLGRDYDTNPEYRGLTDKEISQLQEFEKIKQYVGTTVLPYFNFFPVTDYSKLSKYKKMLSRPEFQEVMGSLSGSEDSKTLPTPKGITKTSGAESSSFFNDRFAITLYNLFLSDSANTSFWQFLNTNDIFPKLLDLFFSSFDFDREVLVEELRSFYVSEARFIVDEEHTTAGRAIKQIFTEFNYDHEGFIRIIDMVFDENFNFYEYIFSTTHDDKDGFNKKSTSSFDVLQFVYHLKKLNLATKESGVQNSINAFLEVLRGEKIGYQIILRRHLRDSEIKLRFFTVIDGKIVGLDINNIQRPLLFSEVINGEVDLSNNNILNISTKSQIISFLNLPRNAQLKTKVIDKLIAEGKLKDENREADLRDPKLYLSLEDFVTHVELKSTAGKKLLVKDIITRKDTYQTGGTNYFSDSTSGMVDRFRQETIDPEGAFTDMLRSEGVELNALQRFIFITISKSGTLQSLSSGNRVLPMDYFYENKAEALQDFGLRLIKYNLTFLERVVLGNFRGWCLFPSSKFDNKVYSRIAINYNSKRVLPSSIRKTRTKGSLTDIVLPSYDPLNGIIGMLPGFRSLTSMTHNAREITTLAFTVDKGPIELGISDSQYEFFRIIKDQRNVSTSAQSSLINGLNMQNKYSTMIRINLPNKYRNGKNINYFNLYFDLEVKKYLVILDFIKKGLDLSYREFSAVVESLALIHKYVRNQGDQDDSQPNIDLSGTYTSEKASTKNLKTRYAEVEGTKDTDGLVKFKPRGALSKIGRGISGVAKGGLAALANMVLLPKDFLLKELGLAQQTPQVRWIKSNAAKDKVTFKPEKLNISTLCFLFTQLDSDGYKYGLGIHKSLFSSPGDLAKYILEKIQEIKRRRQDIKFYEYRENEQANDDLFFKYFHGDSNAEGDPFPNNLGVYRIQELKNVKRVYDDNVASLRTVYLEKLKSSDPIEHALEKKKNELVETAENVARKQMETEQNLIQSEIVAAQSTGLATNSTQFSEEEHGGSPSNNGQSGGTRKGSDLFEKGPFDKDSNQFVLQRNEKGLSDNNLKTPDRYILPPILYKKGEIDCEGSSITAGSTDRGITKCYESNIYRTFLASKKRRVRNLRCKIAKESRKETAFKGLTGLKTKGKRLSRMASRQMRALVKGTGRVCVLRQFTRKSNDGKKEKAIYYHWGFKSKSLQPRETFRTKDLNNVDKIKFFRLMLHEIGYTNAYKDDNPVQLDLDIGHKGAYVRNMRRLMNFYYQNILFEGGMLRTRDMMLFLLTYVIKRNAILEQTYESDDSYTKRIQGKKERFEASLQIDTEAAKQQQERLFAIKMEQEKAKLRQVEFGSGSGSGAAGMGLIAGQGGPGLMVAPQPPQPVSPQPPVSLPDELPSPQPVSPQDELPVSSPVSPQDELPVSPPVSPQSPPQESPSSLKNELLAELKSIKPEVKYYYLDLDNDKYKFYKEDEKIKIKRDNKSIIARDFNGKETPILEGAEVIAILTKNQMGGASDEEKNEIENTFANYEYNYEINLDKLEELQKEISNIPKEELQPQSTKYRIILKVEPSNKNTN